MKNFLSLFLSLYIVLQLPAFAADGGGDYFSKGGHTFSRGIQNALTFYMDIPLTVKEYHEQSDGLVGVRHVAGFSDGLVRSLHRALSAGWDVLWAFVPDHQEGSSIQPETLF